MGASVLVAYRVTGLAHALTNGWVELDVGGVGAFVFYVGRLTGLCDNCDAANLP